MKLRLQAIFRILWGLSCLLYFVVVIADYLQFKENPELYPIGENWGWSYESARNYILASWIVICWSVTGMIMAAAYRLKYNGTVLFVHFTLSAILITYNWVSLHWYN